MSFLKNLVWGLGTREGRDQLFGVSKQNRVFYTLRSKILREFRARYPEMEVSGSVDNFRSVIQWSDGIRQYCYCVPEDESDRAAMESIRRKLKGNHQIYFLPLPDASAYIPLLLEGYKTYVDYIAVFPISLNIVLANLWLRDTRLRQSFNGNHTTKANKNGECDWLEKQASNYVLKINNPDISLKSIAQRDKYTILLFISQVLLQAGAQSVIEELPFREIPEPEIGSLDVGKISVEIEFWSEVLFHRFRKSPDFSENPVDLFPGFRAY